MNIHEHQAKTLLARFKAPLLRGAVAYTPAEAAASARALGGAVWVVKAQIHAGGRGKAGGVKVVKSVEEVKQVAEALLGRTLVTAQTGPAGKTVHRLYVEEGCRIAKEYYVSLLLDRSSGRLAIVASAEGGMDIEEVAAHHPEKILKLVIDPVSGLKPFHQRCFSFFLGLEGVAATEAMQALKSLYDAFVELDATLIEINPLVVTTEGRVILLDAKMSFDDNALFRHADLVALRDETEEAAAELEARQHGLSYIKLDGNIGCMVNGAGLAMATMDIIKLKGGVPANFLDVGGGASREKVTEAFRILLSDPAVKGLLVNIFGGIMKCDVIAEGIIAAAHQVSLRVPLVVRLAGTNVDKGKALLANSSLPIISADTLDEAAEKIVASVKAGK